MIIWILNILNIIPLIRDLLNWILERRLEVEVTPHWEDMSFGVSAPNQIPGFRGGVSAYLDLKLINHSSKRPERIIACWAELRKRRLVFWRRTLSVIPVEMQSPDDWQVDIPISDIYLPPLSAPQTYFIKVVGDFENFEMPRKSELVLILRMVGQIRKHTHKLTVVIHEPEH